MRGIIYLRWKGFGGSAEWSCEPRLRIVCDATDADRGIMIARSDIADGQGPQSMESSANAGLKGQSPSVSPMDANSCLCLARRLYSICSDYTDFIEPFGTEGIFLDVSSCQTNAEALAPELLRRIQEELKLEFCVGIAFTKAFARLASGTAKPASPTCITPENFKEKLWQLPAWELMYVNSTAQCRLAALGIYTVGDLANADEKLLSQAFGIQGELFRQLALGSDVSPVLNEGAALLGVCVSNSIFAPRDMLSDGEVYLLLQLLADSASACLQRSCLQGSVLSLSMGDCENRVHSFQKKLTRATAVSADIVSNANSLFRENWNWDRPVRSLHLRIGALNFPGFSLHPDMPTRGNLRRCELEETVGELRRRFGHGIIARACMLHDGSVHSRRVQYANSPG